jgi:nucleoside-diphosphate-sugar epimerase
MDVLITGGTGYIGAAVVAALRQAGHNPIAVAHSPRSADHARALGATVAAGDLRQPERLAELAARADAVIHTANTNGGDAADVDANATRALLAALAASGKPFVYTSGTWVLGSTGDRVVDENAALDPIPLIAWRAGLEAEVTVARGVRGIVVRPGVVFGDNGGIPAKVARGEIAVVGDGRQRWPLVHVRDLAELYVRAPLGAILHGVATTATMRDIALLGAASRRADGVSSLPLAAARERFGAFADALALDQVVSASRTRTLTGWKPVRRSLIEELLGGPDYPAAAA